MDWLTEIIRAYDCENRPNRSSVTRGFLKETCKLYQPVDRHKQTQGAYRFICATTFTVRVVNENLHSIYIRRAHALLVLAIFPIFVCARASCVYLNFSPHLLNYKKLIKLHYARRSLSARTAYDQTTENNKNVSTRQQISIIYLICFGSMIGPKTKFTCVRNIRRQSKCLFLLIYNNLLHAHRRIQLW